MRLNNIADPELLFKDDKQSGDDVFDEALSAKTERQTEDSGTGEEGWRLNTPGA
ncbi:MAG TPA: hypothetical protein PLH17_00590 [Bacilli bacterium]|nr:hypothetical protein [Bacilli bacterium]HOR20310.1 hypothetical protein [Bacilli bacterium]HPK67256.1 hypothetical protein [Bacilli bacterium]